MAEFNDPKAARLFAELNKELEAAAAEARQARIATTRAGDTAKVTEKEANAAAEEAKKRTRKAKSVPSGTAQEAEASTKRATRAVEGLGKAEGAYQRALGGVGKGGPADAARFIQQQKKLEADAVRMRDAADRISRAQRPALPVGRQPQLLLEATAQTHRRVTPLGPIQPPAPRGPVYYVDPSGQATTNQPGRTTSRGVSLQGASARVDPLEVARAEMKQAQAVAASGQQAGRAGASYRSYGEAVAFHSRQLGMSDNAYIKHGFLTSEFIDAAKRGEVSMKELGRQVTGTIYKFGGWTAAAAAVYGVVGAFSQLYKGAIDAESGVDKVYRVVTTPLPGGRDQLRSEFTRLSGKYNVPVSDTVDAVYGSAKAFGGDLPQALKAAESALFAVKVGELDAGKATESLNAIVRGFALEAGELPAVFDAINQAQNRFGGNVGDLVQGVAKAGGAIRLAGGDYRDLIGILQTISRLTGVTNVEAATAVSRSASRVLTPQGQKALREVGLDPSLKYPELLQQAADSVKGKPREQVNAIARALVPSGGQFARLYAPLLQNFDRYSQTIRPALTEDKTKGSAERELKRVLGQIDEQIAAISVKLQQLGANLAASGALTLLGGFVQLLNTSLTLTNNILSVFNKLPGPLRTVVATSAQLAGILAVMRRYDVGASLGERGAGGLRGGAAALFGRSPKRTARLEVEQGVRDQLAFENDRLRRGQRGAATAAAEAEFYGSRAKEVRAQRKAPGVDPEEAKALKKEEKRLTQATRRAVQAQSDYALQVDQSRAAIEANNQQLSTFREEVRKKGTNPADAARRAGIPYTNATLDREVAADPVRIEDATRRVDQNAGRLNRLSSSVSRGAESARTVANKIPFDGILIGAVVAFQVYSYITDQQKKTAARIDELSAGVNPAAIQSAAENEIKARSFFERIQDYYSSYYRAVSGPLQNIPLIGSVIPDGGLSPNQQQDAQARKDLARAKSLREAQAKGQNLSVGTIDVSVKRDLAGVSDVSRQIARVKRAIQQYKSSAEALSSDPAAAAKVRAGIRGLEAQLQDLTAIGKDTAAALSSIQDAEGLDVFITAASNRASLTGGRGGSVRRYSLAISRARELIAAESDPAKIADLIKQRDDAISGIEKALQDEFNRSLALAQGPRAQGRVRRRYVQRFSRGRLGGLRQRISQIEESNDFDLNALDDIASSGGRGRSQQAAQTQALRARIDRRRKVLKGLKQELALGEKDVKALTLEQQQAQFEVEQQFREARTNLRVARTADPIAQVREQIRSNAQTIAALVRADRTETTDYINALTQGRQLRQQLVQQNIARFQAQQGLNLSQANAGAPQGEQLQNSLNAAKQFAAFIKAQGDKVDPNVYLNALQGVQDAQNALTDYMRQQAQALITAQSVYAQSQTEDPIKQQRIQLREAQKLVKFAETPAEKLTALANVNNKKRELRQNIQRQKFEDVEFEAEIGKIDRATEISLLEKQLATIKGNKQLKRDIQRRIYQLKQEADSEASGFVLDVGSLKLPTIFDVRRAFDPVREQVRARAAATRQLGGGVGSEGFKQTGAAGFGKASDGSINITVNVADAKSAGAVYDAIDRALGTKVKARMRSRKKR